MPPEVLFRVRRYPAQSVSVSDPMDVRIGQLSLFSHRTRVIRSAMGVLSAVVRIFNETAMQARTPASSHLAKAIRASYGPRVSPHTQAKVRVKKTREDPKENPKEPKVGTKGAKGLQIGKTSKTGLSGLENSKSEASSETLESGHVCTTELTMVGVLINGMIAGVLLDDTNVGNKRMTLPQAHLHLEVWISVPPVVRSGSNG